MLNTNEEEGHLDRTCNQKRKREQSNRWHSLQVFGMKAAGHIEPRANARPMWANTTSL
ncbi:hypothetical protein FIBSPDRAFT_880571 [Athelia psychrophila]|uniref:Uncharacterized protein n=1 Tax=Athelia psychrophila TaxID=1759441 RepID=A0A167SNK3_9AGAM|nr:hypothetical protein FIBSPDRAFT_880571 [Fibularhizoctonia sp. CBS 109695]